MCNAILMHYVETHWEPMDCLFAQIGSLSSCGIVPPTGTCSCDIINEPFVSQGEDGSGTPSSLPSLESQSPSLVSRPSPSPINSIYYIPSFLQSAPGPLLNSTQEEFTLIFQGGVIEVGSEGLPLLGDEGWGSGCSGCDEVDPFAGRG